MTDPVKPPPPEPIEADTYDAALLGRMCAYIEQHMISFCDLTARMRRSP